MVLLSAGAMSYDVRMPFHGLYNSRRATPPQPSIAAVWGELARRYVKPELNAKSGPEEIWKGVLFLRKMGYIAVDSETQAPAPDITPGDMPEIANIVAQPRAAKKSTTKKAK